MTSGHGTPRRTDEAAVFDGRVPAPDFVNIETTRFCNLHCPMCITHQQGVTVSGPHMELGEFQEIAGQVFPFVRRWQPSATGEPTMTRDFLRMIELAEEYGVKIDMVSNGTLLNDRTIEALVPNLALLTVSFDGATAETFEYIRKGARFDKVKANIRELVRCCRARLAPELQPEVGLAVTLMERNVRELPQLVRLAKEELDLDWVSCCHVYPVTGEMRQASLIHHRELAARCLDEAFEVAREVGIAVSVLPLDQLTAANVDVEGSDRECSVVDGVVEGLEGREVNADLRRPWPLLEEGDPDQRTVSERRAKARADFDFPPRRPGDPHAVRPDSIWWCESLWNQMYVHIGGNVRPCCVHEVPDLGNLHAERFDRLWNNESYRAMRQRMVAKDPVPACKGCMQIHEITDPVRIGEYLQGRAVPRSEDLLELPAALDPARQRKRRTGAPPELVWDPAPGARSYVIEFSLDRFTSVLFSTDSLGGGPAIRENRYRIPPWAWKESPPDREVFYRVLAKRAGGAIEVARGSIPAQSG